MSLHCCVRVCSNGDRVVEWRSAQDLSGWLQHNSTWRFGQALFVDGETRAQGYLTLERCRELSLELTQDQANGALRPPRTPRR